MYQKKYGRRPYLGPPGPADPNTPPPAPYLGPEDAFDESQDPGEGALMHQAQQSAASGNRYGLSGDSAAAIMGLGDQGVYEGPVEKEPKALVSHGQGPEDPDVVHDPESDYWGEKAPEAKGTASFTTTPENAAPRPETPFTKDQSPKINSNPDKSPTKWDTYMAKSAELEKAQKKMNSWWMPLIAAASPAMVHTMQANLASMRKDRDEVGRLAQYDDNRKGEIEAEKEKGRNERAALRASGVKAQAEARDRKQKDMDDVLSRPSDDQGHKLRWDEATGGYLPVSAPGVPQILDTDNSKVPIPAGRPYLFPHEAKGGGGAPHYETDDKGDVHVIEHGKETNVIPGAGKKYHEPRQPEDPEKKQDRRDQEKARDAAMKAGAAFDRVPENADLDPAIRKKKRAELVKQAFEQAGGIHKGAMAEKMIPVGTMKNFRVTATGNMEPRVMTKNGWKRAVGGD